MHMPPPIGDLVPQILRAASRQIDARGRRGRRVHGGVPTRDDRILEIFRPLLWPKEDLRHSD